MNIRELQADEAAPMELLLLADPSERLVDDYISRGEIFVAEDDGRLIGVYVLLPTRPGTVEVINVAVVEHLHGKGIGKSLVKHAVYSAKERGYTRIDIGTGNSSIGQLALYQKCGFRITGVDKDFFVKYYDKEIFEDGIQVRDMIRLSRDL
ncbi:GNAT family N-acetyltransferase [Alteribacillus sp. HJP-4]|uniref:GNAT family N-acetyltransferase n=1 Tax=Alteribacillus sp. HJP-4 TaxID=2775394 RepID=UPI0035CD27BA